MNNWRERARVVGAGLIVAGVVTPILAVTSGAGAATGATATTTTVVSYRCVGSGFISGLYPVGSIPDQNVTLTITAPVEVTVAQPFDVSVDVSPLTLADPGFPITPVLKVNLSPVGATATGTGYAVSSTFSGVGKTFAPPRAMLTATPTAAAGSSVSFTAENLSVVVADTGFVCTRVSSAPATIATKVVAALTTTTIAPTTTGVTTSTIPGATTTTVVGATTTSTAPTTVPATTTTVAPTTTAGPTTTAVPPTVVTTTAVPPTVPATPGLAAQIVTPSATSAFSCNIYDTVELAAAEAKGGSLPKPFNQNALPESVISIAFTVPDKVGIDGAISGLVKMDPGPMNGPIALKAGTANYAITLAATGATPATLRLTAGPNGSQIEPNTASASPNMPFTLNTTALAGEQVVIGVTKAEVIVTSPVKLTTRCLPVGSGVSAVAKVAVSAQAVVSPAQLTRTVTAGAAGAAGAKSVKQTTVTDGYANCAAAKADGRGTILKSDPAYRARLDGDNDGLACETGDPKVLGVSLARTGGNTNTMLLMSAAMCGSGIALVALSRARRRR